MYTLDELEKLTEEIKNKVSYINSSLDTLLQDIIRAKTKIDTTISLYDDSVKECFIGDKFLIVPLTADMMFIDGAKISISSISDFDIECSYEEILSNTIIRKKWIDRYVNAIKDNYFYSSDQTIKCSYSDDINVTNDNNANIPNVKYFRDNYVTYDQEAIDNLIILSRDTDEAIHLSGFTYNDVLNEAAVNKIKSTINAKIDRYFSVGDLMVYSNSLSIPSDYDKTITIEKFGVDVATKYNSVIDEDIIDKLLIEKDLSNVYRLYIESDPDGMSLIKKEELTSYLVSLGIQKSKINADKDFNYLFLTEESVPSSPIAIALRYFYEETDDYMKLINDPDHFIDLILNLQNPKQEPVTLTGINLLIALYAHKYSGNTLIVTNKEYNEIIENKSIYLDADETLFEVCVKFRETEAVTLNDIYSILD